jgi:cytochrome b6-f complex iron-sulfur subunit
MERKLFITLMGKAAAGGVLATCFGACSKDTESRDLDFTIDLSASENSALQANGGSRMVNGVVVARTNDGEFIAVSARCTHQGTTVQFEGSNNRFRCPNHGATFGINGVVTNGPARANLQRFDVQLSGNSLRVFSA